MRATVPRASDLALAFAIDTVAAALACPEVDRVIVVTDDQVVRDAMATLGTVTFVSDPRAGLNAAVTAGLSVATGARAVPGPVAVLTGDRPALTAHDLSAGLRLAARLELGMVADADGSGTTMLTGRSGAVDPRFGPGSRARHEAAGHVVLDIDDASPLRRDVDTSADLAAAVALGVGRHTGLALALIGAD